MEGHHEAQSPPPPPLHDHQYPAAAAAASNNNFFFSSSSVFPSNTIPLLMEPTSSLLVNQTHEYQQQQQQPLLENIDWFSNLLSSASANYNYNNSLGLIGDHHHHQNPLSSSVSSAITASSSSSSAITRLGHEEDHLEENGCGGGGGGKDSSKLGKIISNSRSTKKKVSRPTRFAFQTKSADDILDDGYRWRKYGQKAVKNSIYPRSYYRCTHHTCNVKKQIQRLSKDTSIVMTTYEGVHNHPCEKLMESLSPLLRQMQFLSRF